MLWRTGLPRYWSPQWLGGSWEVWGGAPDWLPPAASGQSTRPQTGSHQTGAASSVYPRRPKHITAFCACHEGEKGWGALFHSTSPTVALNMCSAREPAVQLDKYAWSFAPVASSASGVLPPTTIRPNPSSPRAPISTQPAPWGLSSIHKLNASIPPLSPKSTMGNEMLLETPTLPFIKEKRACVLNSVVEAFCSSLYNVPAVPSRVPCPW